MSLKQQLARRISRRYVFAVTLIALSAVLTQAVLQYYLHELDYESREINLAGKMRMLTQRTVKLALLIQRDNGGDRDQARTYRLQLTETTQELSAIFEGLRFGDRSLGVQPPPTAEAISLFDAAAPLLETSLGAAAAIVTDTPRSSDFARNLEVLLANDDALLAAIAEIPALYDTLASGEVNRLSWVEAGLLLFTLLVLLLELQFIFRPIIRMAVEALAQVEEEAEEAKRLRQLAAMGEMSGGVAHELNSPLAALSFAIQRLQRRLKKGRPLAQEELAEQLDKMSDDALRMGEIVQSIRALAAGKLPESKRPHHADALFRRAIDAFHTRYGRGFIPITMKPGAEQCTLEAVGYQLEQVLTNLLKNAAEAIAVLPEPWIELSAVADSNEVRLLVKDAGSGIPAHIAERIFDPFFTTREIGQGMGLGLALSQKLVELHGGTLHYEIDDGHTAFVITLPVLSRS
jgi:signal transduction histidine kinase